MARVAKLRLASRMLIHFKLDYQGAWPPLLYGICNEFTWDGYFFILFTHSTLMYIGVIFIFIFHCHIIVL